MSKQKSVIVTVIIAVLAGIVIFAAYRMWQPAFIVITAALAGVGFWSTAVRLCGWLEAETFKPEEAVEPLDVKGFRTEETEEPQADQEKREPLRG